MGSSVPLPGVPDSEGASTRLVRCLMASLSLSDTPKQQFQQVSQFRLPGNHSVWDQLRQANDSPTLHSSLPHLSADDCDTSIMTRALEVWDHVGTGPHTQRVK